MTDTKKSPTIAWIRNKAENRQYHISEHVIRFLMARKLTIQETEDAISNGKIIEIHQNPMRGDSFLILGYSGEKLIHVMCARGKNDWLIILFAYVPSPPMWEDPENRSKLKGKDMVDRFGKCFFCGGEIKEITVGNFDYRLKGQLYVIKNVPAGLCLQCGEK
ncbi:DUF4258 domain-containing protein [Desulfonema magnum]|uniref:Zinc finger domain-containing protein, MqsA-type n=1 Tax=Desulfonema magnum TaxID=45655 RepID=A0A975BW52_9BACT|nr:DUF4258 domain-containing protein [Desulfonema magnum]QTA92866.1 Zinc finger domain-containing protein, MqsA-type [Desulfonema magnum]